MSHSLQEGIRRQAIIRPLLYDPNVGKKATLNAALRLGCSERHVRRQMADYAKAPVATTLTPHAGPKLPRKRRLPAATVEIMSAVIRKRWLGRKEVLPARKLLALIERVCRRAASQAPSLRTLQRELKKVHVYEKALAKKIKGDPRRYKLYPHHFVAEKPGDVIQIDHTLVDLFLNLSAFGLGWRRIWLTLAIDVASRLVFGYHLGLKPPSGRTSGLALMQGMLPKRRWVEACGISYQPFDDEDLGDPWPVIQALKLVHCDNGSDFKGRAFRRGCMLLGAEVYFRPVGKPHYGAHIERLLGTFNKSIHGLPGTTFSNVLEKGRYPSKDQAFLTLEDFERWFLLELFAYHMRPHEGLGGLTPLEQFRSLAGGLTRRAPLVIDRADLRAAFLPMEKRIVRSQGIRFMNRWYWHPNMGPLLGRRLSIRFHPARVDKIWVCLDGMRPSFEARMIGDVGRCIHMDALVDRMRTTEVQEEVKRQGEMANRLFLAQEDLVSEARKRHLRERRRAELKALQSKPGLPAERPVPSQPGNVRKW